MTKFKIRIGNTIITQETPKKQLDALKKHYPHLNKMLKDGKKETTSKE